MKTQCGYDYYEVISALQKSVRRGLEEDAFYWSVELIESGYLPHLLNRLVVIAHEDCSHDYELHVYADIVTERIRKFHKGKQSWRLPLANLIMRMCRATKSRESDHFMLYCFMKRATSDEKKSIPDYALDRHTRRGKKMGRGEKFFRNVSTKLNKDDDQDNYREKFWEFNESDRKKIFHNPHKYGGKKNESLF